MRVFGLAPIALVFAATACGGGGGNAAGTRGTAAAPATGASMPATNAVQGGHDIAASDNDRLAGSWSRDADCGRKLVIRADGTLTGFDGAAGRWTLRQEDGANMLRMTNADVTAEMKVTFRGDDEIEVQDVGPGPQPAETFTMQRCR